jgi:hypothetical protein
MLTFENGQQSLARVIAVFPMTTEQSKRYIETVVESCAFMDAFGFDSACKEVVTTAAPGKPPPPSQFVAAYHRIKNTSANPYSPMKQPPPETDQERKAREHRLMAEVVRYSPQQARALLPYAKVVRGAVFPEEAIEYLERLAEAKP